ncbi:SDR family NAD(P)-dependent oxidoreductase [Nocardia pneumoniae]|uniref:SDR family NAD(P)-dependent oxidoreductase n=1 Tax=Nocardia pneumoniae TaxID=228601 RepID=UPI000315B2C2|nr:SDR family NAD(P)-dependent oxidoreductase [Nocardia pneumoniae]
MRALVTGASAGIGRAFAVSLAAQGYSVTAVARGADVLEALIAQLGDRHDYLAADLGTEKGLQAVAERLRRGGYTLLSTAPEPPRTVISPHLRSNLRSPYWI